MRGDAIVVTKPDRLARSTAELLAIEADLSKRCIGLVILSMGGERLDTRNPTSRPYPGVQGPRMINAQAASCAGGLTQEQNYSDIRIHAEHRHGLRGRVNGR